MNLIRNPSVFLGQELGVGAGAFELVGVGPLNGLSKKKYQVPIVLFKNMV